MALRDAASREIRRVWSIAQPKGGVKRTTSVPRTASPIEALEPRQLLSANASMSQETTATERQSVVFDFTASNDSADAQFSGRSINWGDGQTESFASESVTPVHTYGGPQ